MIEEKINNKAPIIIGSNFTLRRPRPSDINDRLEIGKSREFVRMCGGDTRNMKPLSPEQIQNWYKRICSREYDWIIDYKDKCIGGIRLTLNSEDQNAMLAIGIFNESMLGRGIGTESIRLVLDYSFNTLNLHRVQLRVLEYNKRAIASYMKCGFKIEGTLRDNAYIEDKWENDLMMGVLRDEFMNTSE